MALWQEELWYAIDHARTKGASPGEIFTEVKDCLLEYCDREKELVQQLKIEVN